MRKKNNTIRINYIGILGIVLLFAIIIIRLAFISLSKNVDGINLKKFASNRNTTTNELTASRGTIFSVNGETLAQDVNSYTVIAYLSPTRTTDKKNPKHVVDKEYTANALSEFINMTPEDILKLLNQELYQVELGPGGRNISENKKQKIDALDLPGIDFISSSKRYYPFGDFASYIIGYAKKNDTGQIVGELGVESFYNKELTGKNGYTTYQQDAYGYQIVDTPVIEEKAVSGKDIYLTIDSNVQMYLENAVAGIMNDHSAEFITVTVADAKTGAILGSASEPSYNPNKLNITNFNNPLVSYSYEPGSTMKIFSFMAAMEEGKYNGSEIYDSGAMSIGEDKVTDWNKYGWGQITYDVGFTYSSNVAAAKLGLAIGRDKLIDYYEKFGFGSKTGIEMADEYKGDIDPIYKIEVANAAFGQGIMTTPIQNIEALTSIANDGTTLKPYIVSKIIDHETGKIMYKAKRKEVEKVVSTSTVDKIKELMYLTVNSDDKATTGQIYRTQNTTLIGKTGTAQIVNSNGTYSHGEFDNIRSFAGLFPYEDPKFIIYISAKRYDGASSEIAKAVKSIVESISKYKNLSELVVKEDKSQIIKVKNYINSDIDASEYELNSLGLNVIKIGNGSKVIDQYPMKNNDLPKGSKIFLLTNSNDLIMPYMIGWTSGDVTHFCNLINIECNINGYGVVANQSINAGEKIESNTKVGIELNKNKGEVKEVNNEKEQ